jgi:hypothetical protein
LDGRAPPGEPCLLKEEEEEKKIITDEQTDRQPNKQMNKHRQTDCLTGTVKQSNL